MKFMNPGGFFPVCDASMYDAHGLEFGVGCMSQRHLIKYENVFLKINLASAIFQGTCLKSCLNFTTSANWPSMEICIESIDFS